MWTNASPSRVRLSITPADGHSINGSEWAVDGAPTFQSLPKAVLNWCILLPPGYSYESDTTLQRFVEKSGLTPGLYRVRAVFESGGISADTYFNPLLNKAQELEQLREQDWKGVRGSNALTIRIIGSSQNKIFEDNYREQRFAATHPECDLPTEITRQLLCCDYRVL